MLVYDICNEKSFENIKNWIRNIEEVHTSITGYSINHIQIVCVECFNTRLCLLSPKHASSDVEKMILGNKCDISDRRQVSKDRGEKVSRVASFGLALVYGSNVANVVFFLYFTKLAIDYGIKYLETSAKSSLNVEEVSVFSVTILLHFSE